MSRMIDYCDIACDHCGNWEKGNYSLISDQRRFLKKAKGWNYLKKERKDICPECLEKEVHLKESSNGQT